MHAANPVSHVLYSSGTRLPNVSSFNASTGVDYRRLAPHFDQFQPMEYCSLDNGTAACAPTSWVNESINSYAAAGIDVHGKVMPIWPWIGPAYLVRRDTDQPAEVSCGPSVASLRAGLQGWRLLDGEGPIVVGWIPRL